MSTVLVRNAERMMTAASLLDTAIQCTFADGASGLIPYADVPEISDRDAITGLELPNAYEMIVTLSDGQHIEIPWDFARHYCDKSYRPTIEAIAATGRKTLGRTHTPKQGVGRANARTARWAGEHRPGNACAA